MSKETIEKLFEEPKENKSIGVYNIDKRLKNLYHTGLYVESTIDLGTCVSFSVPKWSHDWDIEIGIVQQKEDERDLKKKYRGHSPCKIFVSGFVPERIHSDDASDASSDNGNEEKSKLGNAPWVLFGTCFVDPHDDEPQEVNCHHKRSYP